jgi:zinc protease
MPRPGSLSTAAALLWLGCACHHATKAPAASVPPPAPAPQIARATLENGLRVVAVRSAIAPVVTTEITYLAGSDEAPLGFPGTAHAQEHMMFRGSEGLSAAQLSTLTAAMGGEFNAETQQTVTQYYFTVPADDLDIALRVETIRMRGVLDSEELWEQERGAIEQEVAQDLSSPEYLLYSKVLAQLFAGTPYAVDALGTRESFERTTGAMLKRFHGAWYAPNNAILVISGDVDPDLAIAHARELFRSIPARPLPARRPVELKPLVPAEIRIESDLPYGVAFVAYRLPGYESPDWAAGQVLADVLDDPRSALADLVIEGKALSVSFEGTALPKGGLGYATGAFPAEAADGPSLIKAMRSAVAHYVEHGVPAELVEAAKRREATAFQLQKGSIPGLAALWSQALAVEGRESPEEDLMEIERVTPADVTRVARAWLSDATAVTALLTPRRFGNAVPGQPVAGSESFAPSHAEPVALPDWATRAMAAPQVPPVTLNPVATVLPNGIRLVVVQAPEVPVAVLFGAIRNDPDVETPPGLEGVDQVLDRLFTYGTTTLDRLAFRRAVDDIGATLSAGTNFSVEVAADHFERAVELLADNVLNPALPDRAFAVVRKQTADTLAGLLPSPAYLAQRARDRALYPKGDPRWREATPTTVSNLTLADVRRYHRLVYRPDMTTVVVLGNVAPGDARAVVERHFGAWKAVGETPKTDPPPVAPNRPSASRVPDASRVQDSVLLAQTLSMTRFDRDYYPLELANNVLAGAFYATRLFRDLRERTGLVYNVGADLRAARTRSVFEITYACDPSNVSKARALVERDLRELQVEPLSERDLMLSRAILIRRIPLSEASLERIARGLLDRALLDLPLNEPRIAARRYLEITAEEIREAFARHIRPSGFAQVTLGPPPGEGR